MAAQVVQNAIKDRAFLALMSPRVVTGPLLDLREEPVQGWITLKMRE